MLDQHLAEDIGPGVVVRNPHPRFCRLGERRAIPFAIRNRRQQIDPGKPLERGRDRQQFRLGEGIGDAAAKRELPDAGRLRRMGDDDNACRP